MVYDPLDHEVILFGGQGAAGPYYNDTWVFRAGDWTDLNASVTHAPPGRIYPSLTYDATDRYVLLFGGTDSYWFSFNCYGQNFQDTWAFSGGVWTQLAIPFANSPAQRYGAALAYDSASGSSLMFGGALNQCATNSTLLYNDTWSFVGGRWNQTNTTTSPSARWEGGLAFDSMTHSLLLFGGWVGGIPFYQGQGATNDSWRFRNGSWQALAVPGPPLEDSGFPMIVDPVLPALVLFGVPMWAFDGQNWSTTGPAPFPPATSSSLLTYDGGDGYVILFGGEGPYQSPTTWTFTGGHWIKITSNQQAMPSVGASETMTYDPVDNYVVLFGGYLNETWTFRGGIWTKLDTPLAPSARYGARLAFDPLDGYAVLFGGSDYCSPDGTWFFGCHWFNDTWGFVHGKWFQIAPKGGLTPRARSYGAMTLEAANGNVLLFGGIACGTRASNCSVLNDTWEFGGGGWDRVLTSVEPSARAGAVITYDATNGSVVLFGGSAVDSTGSYTAGQAGPWVFDGASWTELNATGDVPPTRTNDAFVYDPELGQSILYPGGGDAWLLQLRPGHGLPLAVSVVASDLVGDVPLVEQFSAIPAGGVPPYYFEWIFGDGSTAALASPQHTYLSSGNYVATAVVIDVVGHRSQQNVTVRVLVALTVAISAGPLSGAGPLSVQLTGTVRGGAVPYSILWSFGDGSYGIVLNSSHTYTFTGQYFVSVNVTDRFGSTAGAGPLIVVVNSMPAPLQVSLAVTPNPSVLGAEVKLSTTIAGGVAPLGFTWSGLPPGCSGVDAASLVCHPDSYGTFDPTVTIADAMGNQVVATAPLLIVPPSLHVELQVDPAYVQVAGPVRLTATFSGGVGPVHLLWVGLPIWCVGSGGPVEMCTPPRPGASPVGVVVNDSANQTASANTTILVEPSAGVVSHARLLGGLDPTETLALGLGVGAAIATILVWIGARRVKKGA